MIQKYDKGMRCPPSRPEYVPITTMRKMANYGQIVKLEFICILSALLFAEIVIFYAGFITCLISKCDLLRGECSRKHGRDIRHG